MNVYRLSLVRFLVLGACALASSCVNNRTLASFDLGHGRSVKIATDWTDTTLPIIAELFVNGQSKDRSVIEYEGTAEWSVLNKYRYELFSDKTKQIFVIIQTNADGETRPVIALDFDNAFGYPICPIDKCLDCSDGYCPSNYRACFTKFNRIVEMIEAENPGLELKRIEFDDAPPLGCSN